MSEAFRTKHEVIKLIKDCIERGFDALHLDGWKVMEFGQASFQNANSIVTLLNTKNDKIGWQSTSFPDDGINMVRRTQWTEIQHWQLQFIVKQTKENRGADAVLAEDVASMMSGYLNSLGIEYFRANGCSMLVIDPLNFFVYNDDSEVYQKRAVFTLKLMVPKEFSVGQDAARLVFEGVYPV